MEFKREVDVSRIVLVDKPAGITSFGVVAWVRRLLGVRKVGHAGTLDPLATGLMILGAGRGTKELSKFVKLDKSYTTTVVLGVATESADADGEVVDAVEAREAWETLRADAAAETVSVEEWVTRAVYSIVGAPELEVPAYSAIKRDGRPLHKLARRGRAMDLPKRVMRVYAAAPHGMGEDEYGYPTISFSVDVASGVYVRSLAVEIGRVLGLPAHVLTLRRTKVGEFVVEDAVAPARVAQRYAGVDFDSK